MCVHLVLWLYYEFEQIFSTIFTNATILHLYGCRCTFCAEVSFVTCTQAHDCVLGFEVYQMLYVVEQIRQSH